jgi:hypothetical protein
MKTSAGSGVKQFAPDLPAKRHVELLQQFAAGRAAAVPRMIEPRKTVADDIQFALAAAMSRSAAQCALTVEISEQLQAPRTPADPPRRVGSNGHLEPMLDTTLRHLERQGVTDMPDAVLDDAGYWHSRQIESITARGIEVLIRPDGTMREGKRPGWENGLYGLMRRRLSTDRGRELYAQRKITVEPIYGQIKYNRRIDRFMRRGRAAAQSAWRLVAATHNLLKVWMSPGSVDRVSLGGLRGR